jgi:site-specific DNA recombinase
VKKRCAIYTRKSTEEGLDQEFNSLDAQHDACTAFIVSQKHEGWVATKTRYDDGGFSGGTLERPGLQKLLDDVHAQQIDVVVVYKIDRLTRSLTDFAKIVEVFDEHGVSFVSVTQQFNTTTSMGRLTLNVLLSFAQFEREVTAERIRDKIAASKQKGMWMGGVVPLGYDARDKKLVINEAEAERVRTLFKLYLELGTVRQLRDEADRLGIVTKQYVQANGIARGGKPFSRGHLYQLLRNPTYRGLVSHRGTTYAGQHRPIIDEATWQAVQAQLDTNASARVCGPNVTKKHLLTGLMFDETGDRLSPSHATKAGKRYRYYVSRRLVHRERGDRSGWRLAAPPFEKFIIECVISTLRNRQKLTDWFELDGGPIATVTGLLDRAVQCATELEMATFERRRHLLATLLRRVTLAGHELTLEFAGTGLLGLLGDGGAAPVACPDRPFKVVIPIKLGRRGVEMRVVLSERDDAGTAPDRALIRTVAQAHRWLADLIGGRTSSIRDLARIHKVDESDVSRMLPFAFLAPDIVEAIVEGTHPDGLTTHSLKRQGFLPFDWESQRAALGLRV